MRIITTVITMLAMVLLSYPSFARGKKEKTIVLPKVSEDLKLDMAVMGSVYTMMVGIAYAKSVGKTPEDFARFWVEKNPGWKGLKGRGAAIFVQQLHKGFQQDRKFRMEILSVSKGSVGAKCNIFGEDVVKAFSSPTGVSMQEYAKFLGEMIAGTAGLMGLDLKHKYEKGWIYINISEKM